MDVLWEFLRFVPGVGAHYQRGDTIVVIGFCFDNSKWQVYLVKRTDDPNGKYTFPGGKIRETRGSLQTPCDVIRERLDSRLLDTNIREISPGCFIVENINGAITGPRRAFLPYEELDGAVDEKKRVILVDLEKVEEMVSASDWTLVQKAIQVLEN